MTFSGAAYDSTTALIVERAPRLGADEVWVYDDKWLMEKTGYYHTNNWIFNATCRIQDEPTVHKHGFGWCSWKAFVIQSAMDRLSDGDVVFYLDADTFPTGPEFGQVFDICAAEGGILLFSEAGCSNLRFTKADCFLSMGLPIKDSEMACGRFSIWQKGPFLARQVLTEWWAYSINPRCTLWDRSVLQKDQPEYYRNSTEMSVLANLAQKYNIPLHRCPDQWGNPNHAEAYPLFLEQVGCSSDRSNFSGSKYRNIP